MRLTTTPLLLGLIAHASITFAGEPEKFVDIKIDRVVETPSTQGAHRAHYDLDGSVKTFPGHAIELVVPETLRDRAIDFVTLVHRQSTNDDTSHVASIKEWDDTPAYTSVQVYDPSFPQGQRWRYWCGMASGPQGAKFAEIRTSEAPEEEMLYEWRHYGHASLDEPCTQASHAPLKPSLIRLVSTGSDPVRLHSLTVQMTSPAPKDADYWILTPGTHVGDLQSSEGIQFGGGELHSGMYPRAIQIANGKRPGRKETLPVGMTAKRSGLRLELRPGQNLARVEVAAGDSTGFDSHGQYTPGYGHIVIRWIRAGGLAPVVLLSSTNVGPEGVYRGLPETPEAFAAEGDYIEISATGDPIYVMAVRIGYR